MTLVDWGSASRAMREGDSTGDKCLVQSRRGGILVAALDALGHGPEAAAVAAAACNALESDAESSLLRLLQRCHESLRSTRGIALNMAFFDGRTATMTWLGIGNIQGLLVRGDPANGRREAVLLQHAGIVGRTLPQFTPETLEVREGDTLIFATDGIVPTFGRDLPRSGPPQRQADHILDRHYRGNDDGLAMVAIYRGDKA